MRSNSRKITIPQFSVESSKKRTLNRMIKCDKNNFMFFCFCFLKPPALQPLHYISIVQT